ncbi:MAG: ComEA family DNA-binding protein [Nocardioides sp.]
MPTRRPTPDRQDVVSRRLATLSPERTVPGPEELPPVPVPGRHADRRTHPRLGITLGASQLTVVAVLVALGLAVTCWYVVRGDPERVEAPVVDPVAGASATPLADVTPVAATATGGAPTEAVTVDVTGKVRRPGIVVLEAGARVVDALEEAGGARSGVDLSSLNLARLLVDGEQVVVGVPAPVGVAAAVPPTPGGPGAPLVNLNTATQVELETLPQVGPVTAGSILSWRDAHGGFTSVDELLEVDGIGDATLAQLAPLVTV